MAIVHWPTKELVYIEKTGTVRSAAISKLSDSEEEIEGREPAPNSTSAAEKHRATIDDPIPPPPKCRGFRN